MSLILAEAFERLREIRAEYDDLLYAAYERAAEACNDRLLNRRGQQAGIDPFSLFKSNAAAPTSTPARS